MQARVRAELVEIGASDDDEVRCGASAVPIGSAPACSEDKMGAASPSLDSNEGLLLNASVHRVEVEFA